jgi:hypothetical protein
MAAVRRYDGPFFRTARRAQAATSDVETYILSARFGLIYATDLVPLYDQRLTKARCHELSELVAPRLKRLADPDRFSDAFVCAGRDYLTVLQPHLGDLRAVMPLKLAAGGMGEKLTRLAGWLTRRRVLPPARKLTGTNIVSVRGVKIIATREEIFALAEAALQAGEITACRCHGWYVPIDGGRIAPKWLIHKLTSLPVEQFHSDDARRALAALNVPVVPCT